MIPFNLKKLYISIALGFVVFISAIYFTNDDYQFTRYIIALNYALPSAIISYRINFHKRVKKSYALAAISTLISLPVIVSVTFGLPYIPNISRNDQYLLLHLLASTAFASWILSSLDHQLWRKQDS